MSDLPANIALAVYLLGVLAFFGIGLSYPIVGWWKRRRRAREAERRGFIPVMREKITRR